MANRDYKPHDKRHREMQEDVNPPNSRLFILCGKGIPEESFNESFGKYGTIEDIWIVKDRKTNEDKGVVYIKFAKASEAALALEEMNGRVIQGHPKPLKVLVASSKREGSVRDPKEDEKLVRLFVMIPKSFSKSDLRDEFEKYGDIDNVTIVSDRHSGENKGFGYVRFHRPYHAALAYESCDANFKPKFADPKPPARDSYDSDPYPGYGGGYRDSYDRGGGGYSRSDRHDRGHKRGFSEMGSRDIRDLRDLRDIRDMREDFSQQQFLLPDPMITPPAQGPMDMLQSYTQGSGSTRLHVTAPIGLTQGYLLRLFSLIPGLEYCDLNETTGVAYARFSTPQCAAYARDKLDGFEYPIGSRLVVRNADAPGMPPDLRSSADMGYDNYGGYPGNRQAQHGGGGGGGNTDDTVRRAAMILEKAGINPDRVLSTAAASNLGISSQGMERVPYCSIPLPFPQPMIPEDTEVVQRLFIVCQPSGIQEKVLRDAFCRFGNLIDVYLLPAKNYGYAKFASKESAMKAIQNLHGQNLAGNRLKVLEAEPPRPHDDDEPMKKQRM